MTFKFHRTTRVMYAKKILLISLRIIHSLGCYVEENKIKEPTIAPGIPPNPESTAKECFRLCKLTLKIIKHSLKENPS